MLARLSAHCPNFWEVLVKVMLGVTVLLMMAWVGGNTQNSRLMRLIIMNVKPPRVLFYISSWEILAVSHCRRETDSGLFPTPIPQAHSKAMTRPRPVPETPGACHPTQALPGPWHPQY